MNNTRNVEINGTSPKEDVLAALTGIWSKSKINDWTVIHLSSRFEIWQRWCDKAGTFLLPRSAETTLMAKIFNGDGTVACKVVKMGEKAMNASKPCYIEIFVQMP